MVCSELPRGADLCEEHWQCHLEVRVAAGKQCRSPAKPDCPVGLSETQRSPSFSPSFSARVASAQWHPQVGSQGSPCGHPSRDVLGQTARAGPAREWGNQSKILSNNLKQILMDITAPKYKANHNGRDRQK